MNLIKAIIVAGSFNDAGGKASGWARKLISSFSETTGWEITSYNGGSWEELNTVFNSLGDYQVVIWLADVPNDKPKLIELIKIAYPKTLLVSSKRNLDGKYSYMDIVSRALAIKANLTIEISGTRERALATIIDPLGNIFTDHEPDIKVLTAALVTRLNILLSYKRVGSKCIGDGIVVPEGVEIDDFMSLVKEQAETFHKIIHGVSTTRMLGNASFRCARGFPSFRDGGHIFVSRRNVDKRFIDRDAFVAVQEGTDGVEYFGPNKPSVDTPVQLRLYKLYPHINYMLHSHTYIWGALMTKDPVPCGALEEVEQINSIYTDRSVFDFAINIKGHGSICLARSLSFIKSVRWIPRPSPESMII